MKIIKTFENYTKDLSDIIEKSKQDFFKQTDKDMKFLLGDKIKSSTLNNTSMDNSDCNYYEMVDNNGTELYIDIT